MDHRWEEQEISGFTSLLELRIQLGYDLLGGESLDGFGGGHNPLFELSSGITMETEGTGPGQDVVIRRSVATRRRLSMS